MHGKQLHHAKNTLKKNGAVCRTKAQLKEFINNRNDKAYLMKMLMNDKCRFNLSDTEVPVIIIEGIFPMVKVKMKWNDEIFVGWTETVFLNL